MRQPDLDIDLGKSDGEKSRQRVIKDVFEDVKTFYETVIKQGWATTRNKSFEYGKIDQSHLAHVQHGVQVLFSLYRSLPKDHFFVDEDFLRDTVALTLVHDYHKLRDDSMGEEAFDISENEARLFVEKTNLREVSDVDLEAIRGTMAAHHTTDDKAKRSEIPFGQQDTMRYMDMFYFVLLADGLASCETVDEARSQSIRKRATNALGSSFSVVAHTIGNDRDMGEFGNVVNRAVADVLTDNGFSLLRVFSDGCVYVGDSSATLDGSTLNKDVLERVREYSGKARDDYTLDDAKSAAIELESNISRYYKIEFDDILFRGVEDTVEGIIRQSINDSEDASPNENAETGETYAVTVPTKNTMDRLENHVDVNFHTDTRRVEGISQGVHSIRKHFVEFLVQDKDDLPNTAPEWRYDPLMATLKVFGLYDDPEYREQIKELRDKEGDHLHSGKYWDYKFLIGQFVYETYFTGLSPDELTECLTNVVINNFQSFTPLNELEDNMIGDIKAELASWLGINVNLHTGNGETVQLSEYRNDESVVSAYIDTPNKNDCAVCTWGTTASANATPPRLLNMEPDDPAAEIETNVTGAGEIETTSRKASEPLCFACQLEISIRSTNTEEWGEDNVVYAHVKNEYGYNPVSEWVFQETLSYLTNGNTGKLMPDDVSHNIIDNNVPQPVENVFDWETPQMVRALTSVDGGLKSRTLYGGRGVPINTTGDETDLFNAIASVAIACAYSGTRVHISESPLSRVEYNTGQLVTLSETIGTKVPSIGGQLKLSEVSDFIRTVAAMSVLTDHLHTRPFDVFKSKQAAFETINASTRYPASRVAVMAAERGMDISSLVDEIVTLDEQWGTPKFQDTYDALADSAANLNPDASPEEMGEFIRDTLHKVIAENPDNVESWAASEAMAFATDADSSDTVEFAECVTDFMMESNGHPLRTRNEVADYIRVRAHETSG